MRMPGVRELTDRCQRLAGRVGRCAFLVSMGDVVCDALWVSIFSLPILCRRQHLVIPFFGLCGFAHSVMWRQHWERH